MWTASIALDAVGEETAADATLLMGLVSAGAAAATGAAQWQDLQNLETPKRLGTLHATLNVVATLLYGASYVQRRRGNRGAGVTLAAMGFGIVNVSSWLGGDLAYDLGIGVNRTAFEQGPDKWTDVLADDDLPEKTARRVEVDGAPVMLYRLDGEVLALSPTCSHLGGPLDEGDFDGDAVTCPWHKSVFCLRDGGAIHGPATSAQPIYDVQVEKGRISIRAHSE
jgi:nitrite reductase/ring-hydroxylating ferredoxin subunit